MAGLFAFLRYLRLKFLVSIFRLIFRLIASSPSPKPDSVLRIPSRDKHRTIKAHVYKPSAEYAETKGPYPILINFYGSGFVLPLHGGDDDFCRHIVTTTSYVVLDVEYRLAPENPFPAAINDVEDAVKYVLGRPDEYKISCVSLSGFSSGGTLALVAPTLFPRGTFQSVIAFYPATDLARDPSLRRAPASKEEPRTSFWTPILREATLGEMDPRDPRISPIYADTLNYPANMLVVTGELDSMALEAEELAERIKAEGAASGRNVILRRMKGCGHDFDKEAKDDVCVQARDETYGLAVDMLKKVVDESS
jgi:acetyl esterase/lipase